MIVRAAGIRTPGEPPQVADRDAPVPGDGEVLVAVTAAPITPLDLLCASGTSYFGVPRTPYVPGVQGVGTVGGRAVWFPTDAGMAPGAGSMAGAAVVAEKQLRGYTNNELTRPQRAAAVATVAQYAARGALTVAHEVVALDDVADAWRRQGAGRAAGRIVLTP